MSIYHPWREKEEIIYTYPVESGGRTYKFFYQSSTLDNRAVFKTPSGGGLTLKEEYAEIVFHANRAAKQYHEMKDRPITTNYRWLLHYYEENVVFPFMMEFVEMFLRNFEGATRFLVCGS